MVGTKARSSHLKCTAGFVDVHIHSSLVRMFSFVTTFLEEYQYYILLKHHWWWYDGGDYHRHLHPICLRTVNKCIKGTYSTCFDAESDIHEGRRYEKVLHPICNTIQANEKKSTGYGTNKFWESSKDWHHKMFKDPSLSNKTISVFFPFGYLNEACLVTWLQHETIVGFQHPSSIEWLHFPNKHTEITWKTDTYR